MPEGACRRPQAARRQAARGRHGGPALNTPTARRILAVDLGDRRTGLAATDWTGSIEVPLGRLDGLDDAALADEIAAIVRERESEVVVVGLPLSHDGEVGPRARRTLGFVERLRAALPCPVVTVDESHSTDEAHAKLAAAGIKAARRKTLADSLSALVILQRYRTGHR